MSRNLPYIWENEIKQVKWRQNDNHKKHCVEVNDPVRVSWTPLQMIDNLKDDELKHCTWEGKVDAEYYLNHIVSKLIIFKKLLNEEDPPNKTEDKLGTNNLKYEYEIIRMYFNK